MSNLLIKEGGPRSLFLMWFKGQILDPGGQIQSNYMARRFLPEALIFSCLGLLTTSAFLSNTGKQQDIPELFCLV